MNSPNTETLTTQARAGIRRASWRSVALGATGASALGLLGAAGLAPMEAALHALPRSIGQQHRPGHVRRYARQHGGRIDLNGEPLSPLLI